MNDPQTRLNLLGLVSTWMILLASASAVAAPIDLPEDSNGWTIFSPSADSRICYVSADGDNQNALVYSPSDAAIGDDPFNPAGAIVAFSTYAEAYANTREGYPDWILLKRGDVFEFVIGSDIRSGREPDEPFFVGAYGSSGLCPLVKTGSGQGLSARNAQYFAFSGIDF
ncbi:MAG: hypothetical protein PVI89_02120, partial [Desulfobacteraceae bacterium]